MPQLSKLPPAKWLEPAGYGKMFAAGAKNNQAMSCLIDPDALPELDRMCKKFPDTPVIIDHLCRIGVRRHHRATRTWTPCAPWPSTSACWSRSGRSTRWARSRRRTPTWPR